MHSLQNLQKVRILWGTQTSSHTAHIHTKPLAFLPWGHQGGPAKFNFASDVTDHWAGMGKLLGWRRGTELDNLADLLGHLLI